MRRNGSKHEPTITEATAPEKRTARTIEFLMVAFTIEELLALALQLAATMQTESDLEEKIDSQKKLWNQELDALSKSIRSMRYKLNARGEMRNTECEWIFDTPRPKEKTLVRIDTGEVVRIVPMQEADFQDNLPFGSKGGKPLADLTPPVTDGKAAAAGEREKAHA